MTTYEYTTSLTVEGNGSDEEFEEHVFELADELIDLEDSITGLLDSSVGATCSSRTIEVDMTIKAGSFERASEVALSALHSAIHSVGVHAPAWKNKVQINEASQKRLLASA